MIIQLESGSKVEVPDGSTPAQIDEVAQHIQSNSATPQQQAMGSTAGGVITGALEPVMGIGQLAPRAVSEIASLGGNFPNAVSRAADASAAVQDKGAAQLIETRKDARAATGQTGFDYPELAGNILSPANLVVGEGAGALPEAKTLIGRVAQGVATGAAFGGTAPVDTSQGSYADQKVGQVETGAVLGGAAPIAGKVVGKVIGPDLGKEQQLLQSEGVRMTPGQASGGIKQSLENKAVSIPMLGDTIKGAYQRGYEDFNRAVANRALSPIGQTLPDNVDAGNALVSHVQDTLSNEYDRILPQMQGKMDSGLQVDLAHAQGMSGLLPEDRANQMQKIMSNILDKKVSPNGDITGIDAKDILSQLRFQASKYSKSPDPDHQGMADIFNHVKDSFSDMLQRNNSPDLSQALKNTDEGYANFIRLQRASASTNAQGNGGIFTPAQLLEATKATDTSLRKGQFAKGGALMQDLAAAGQKVLPDKVPNSGTTDRGALFSIPGITAAAVTSPLAALYTRPGQAILRGVTSRPASANALSQLVQKYSNPASVAKFATRQ